MSELSTLSLIELKQRLHTRRLSPVELMEAVLARIDETHADLNAVVVRRDPDACVADARAAGERFARGDARPLEGIPLGVKELEAAAGLPWTECSNLFADRIARHSSVQVERLAQGQYYVRFVGNAGPNASGSAVVTDVAGDGLVTYNLANPSPVPGETVFQVVVRNGAGNVVDNRTFSLLAF